MYQKSHFLIYVGLIFPSTLYSPNRGPLAASAASEAETAAAGVCDGGPGPMARSAEVMSPRRVSRHSLYPPNRTLSRHDTRILREKRTEQRNTVFWALRESVYIYTSLPSPLRSTRFSFLFVGLAYRAGCSLSARYLSFSTRARPSADFTVTRDPICTCPKVAFIYLSSILR